MVQSKKNVFVTTNEVLKKSGCSVGNGEIAGLVRKTTDHGVSVFAAGKALDAGQVRHFGHVRHDAVSRSHATAHGRWLAHTAVVSER